MYKNPVNVSLAGFFVFYRAPKYALKSAVLTRLSVHLVKTAKRRTKTQ
jgi:hypothetical protein